MKFLFYTITLTSLLANATPAYSALSFEEAEVGMSVVLKHTDFFKTDKTLANTNHPGLSCKAYGSLCQETVVQQGFEEKYISEPEGAVCEVTEDSVGVISELYTSSCLCDRPSSTGERAKSVPLGRQNVKRVLVTFNSEEDASSCSVFLYIYHLDLTWETLLKSDKELIGQITDSFYSSMRIPHQLVNVVTGGFYLEQL